MALTYESSHVAQVITGDGVVGTSGADTIVWFIACMGGSGAATTADFHAGTSTAGTKRVALAALTGDTTNLDGGPRGILFAGGCYVNITTTGGSVTVVYNQ